MKAYSLDLREQVLTAYHRQEGSIRQLAKRFTVSPRCVGQLIVRFRRTGSYAPQPHGGGNPPRIDAHGRQVVSALVQAQPDATLDELCQRYAGRCQVRPSRSSMHRTLARLKLTRTKRLITRPSVTVKRSKNNVASIKRKCVRWMRAIACTSRRRASILLWHDIMPDRLKGSEFIHQNLSTKGKILRSWVRALSMVLWRR
jgi:transposase